MLNITPYRKHNEVNLYNPFRELEEFERSLFAPDTFASFRTDIEDDGDKLILSADLPGFKKEDIHVDIDADNISASYEDGVLKLALPKQQPTKADTRRLEIH